MIWDTFLLFWHHCNIQKGISIIRTYTHVKVTSVQDDVIKWKHFPHYWPFVRGIHQSLVDSPHKGQWRGALMFLFDLCLDKQLSKQLRCWRFEMPLHSLWCHCNDVQTWACLPIAWIWMRGQRWVCTDKCPQQCLVSGGWTLQATPD